MRFKAKDQHVYVGTPATLAEVVVHVQHRTTIDPRFSALDQLDFDAWWGVQLNDHTAVVARTSEDGADIDPEPQYMILRKDKEGRDS